MTAGSGPAGGKVPQPFLPDACFTARLPYQPLPHPEQTQQVPELFIWWRYKNHGDGWKQSRRKQFKRPEEQTSRCSGEHSRHSYYEYLQVCRLCFFILIYWVVFLHHTEEYLISMTLAFILVRTNSYGLGEPTAIHRQLHTFFFRFGTFRGLIHIQIYGHYGWICPSIPQVFMGSGFMSSGLTRSSR